ncbi:MAG: efflux RND transporter periplasmic adaptor subunit [Alcanivoracaceae bacterium]|nr:efflux RND transporter periplasmic adaptor subunit [Alcanivoracaceae bacterium]
MSKRMIIMLVACAVVFGLVFGLKGMLNFGMNQFFDNMPMPPATITATEAVSDEWVLALDAVGTVRAVNGVEVTTQVAGEVEQIHFSSGDEVKQGDVLVSLDARTDSAQLKALEAAARLAEQEYERFQTLFKQGSISRSELDRRQSERDQAIATANAQRERVAQKTLRAPFSGKLGIRQVDLGQYLNPGNAVVTLQQLDPIYVNFSLPERDQALLQSGLAVRASLSAMPDELFEGEISAIEPGVDPTTRNFNVQASFPNNEQKLRPGMFARISIRLADSEQVVVVPRTAIQYAPYGNSVYVITEKEEQAAEEGEGAEEDKEPTLIVKRRFVKTGSERGDLVAVIDGLKAGERVATSGLLKLRNDATVIINNKVEPSSEIDPRPDNS